MSQEYFPKGSIDLEFSQGVRRLLQGLSPEFWAPVSRAVPEPHCCHFPGSPEGSAAAGDGEDFSIGRFGLELHLLYPGTAAQCSPSLRACEHLPDVEHWTNSAVHRGCGIPARPQGFPGGNGEPGIILGRGGSARCCAVRTISRVTSGVVARARQEQTAAEFGRGLKNLSHFV